LRDLVPLSPHTHAQLNIDGRTISGHYRHHIRMAASQDAFFAQCRENHKWIPSVFKMIHLPHYDRPRGTLAPGLFSHLNSYMACYPLKRLSKYGTTITLDAQYAWRMTLRSISCDACIRSPKRGGTLFFAPFVLQ
jgi:hypothetical protein